MRKIVLMMFIAAGLLSCSKEEVPTTPENTHPISFGTVSTRAAGDRVNSASDIDEFSVWASVSSKTSTEISYVPLLTNEKVYRNPAGSNTWFYDNTQHWISNSYFYFFAAYPYNVGFEQVRNEEGENKFTAYTLDVIADGSNNTEDILVATNVTDTSVDGYATTVPMSFGHLLTKVNLKIRQNFDVDPDFNYYVTKVTITGIKGNAQYIVMPYNNQIGLWWNFENANTITLEKTYSTPMILRNVGAADLTVILSVWNDGLLLIPQEIASGGVKVRIDYLYDVDLNDDDLGTAKYVEGFIPSTEWESGKAINYTLAIANSSFISFSVPTIEPWGAPQTGGTIIIK